MVLRPWCRLEFNTQAEPNGDILMYPEGDKSVPPSGRHAQGGMVFRHHHAPAPD